MECTCVLMNELAACRRRRCECGWVWPKWVWLGLAGVSVAGSGRTKCHVYMIWLYYFCALNRHQSYVSITKAFLLYLFFGIPLAIYHGYIICLLSTDIHHLSTAMEVIVDDQITNSWFSKHVNLWNREISDLIIDRRPSLVTIVLIYQTQSRSQTLDQSVNCVAI